MEDYTNLSKAEILEKVAELLADNESGEISELDIRTVFKMVLEFKSNFTDGKSAYELAVENGFTGTVAEYLLSLVGGRGPKGDVLKHKWADTNLSLENPDGTFGASVNLIGKSWEFSDFSGEQIESFKLKFSQLTQAEKDSLKLLFEHLTDTEKDSLKLKFEHLTPENKESLKPPRLLEIEKTDETELSFDSSSLSEVMIRVDNSTTTSVPVTLINTIPVGWSNVMRQVNSGVFNFVDSADITIIKRDGLLLQTVSKMDTVHVLCVGPGVFEIDGDLKPE